jgi:hypothetical protein
VRTAYGYRPDCYGDTVVAFSRSEANEPVRAALQPAELYVPLLDSTREELATADGPDGNIGYPFEPKEIDQFLAIVQGQSRHLGASHLEQLKKSLHDAAENIKEAQRSARPASAK